MARFVTTDSWYLKLLKKYFLAIFLIPYGLCNNPGLKVFMTDRNWYSLFMCQITSLICFSVCFSLGSSGLQNHIIGIIY